MENYFKDQHRQLKTLVARMGPDSQTAKAAATLEGVFVLLIDTLQELRWFVLHTEGLRGLSDPEPVGVGVSADEWMALALDEADEL